MKNYLRELVLFLNKSEIWDIELVIKLLENKEIAALLHRKIIGKDEESKNK